MKTKVSNLIAATLDWAVAEADQVEAYFIEGAMIIHQADSDGGDVTYNPSSNWGQGGPIIESHGISITREAIEWAAWTWARTRDDAEHFGYGDTALIAAMRCYVQSKLGDEVEIPDELL